MDPAALHLMLDDIAPAAGAGAVDPELAAVEAHAATGCSRCARALVNAREAVAELAVAEAPRAAPAESLRARILARARPAAPPRPPAKPRRFFDPSGELARLHIGGPGDAERAAEVDALGVGTPPEGDACARLLAQIEYVIGFPLLFVSVVCGERVGCRVQRGLDARFGDMRDRRRETTFCTHTVSGGAPMIVPNAAEEPFFRGSNMVLRVGVKSYVGVPLTTSRGVTVGTVCAMDFRPRAVGPEIVRVLELFTEPVLAEIERARRPPEDRLPRTANGAPIHPARWFRALLAVEPHVPATLLVARGPAAEALADAALDHEIAGRLADDTVGLLVSGTRAGEIQRALAATLSVETAVDLANYFP